MASNLTSSSRWCHFLSGLMMSMLITICLCLPSAMVSASSYRLDPNGRNVCSTTRRVQQFQFVPQTLQAYETFQDDDIDETLDSDDEERRQSSSAVSSPLVVGRQIGYAGRQSVRVVNQTVYHCCPGWQSSGRECAIAICRMRCGHGNCTAPDVCSCLPGFMGHSCQMPCPGNRYGPNCELQCNCGMRTCNPATGHCTPPCQAGFMGPNCVMPCPPGRFGPDCIEFCRCPMSLVGGMVLCDGVTGNCTLPTQPTEATTVRTEYESTVFDNTDSFHEFFQYDTDMPSLVKPERKHPLQVKAMKLGISGAAGILLMVMSLVLALYVYRRLKRRPCICLQRKKIRAAMLTQQRQRVEGTVQPEPRQNPPRAHFPNPQLPHAMPYRLPSLCNYTGLRQTNHRPHSIGFDSPGTVHMQSKEMSAAPLELPSTSTKLALPDDTIYEVRPSLVAKTRLDRDLSSGYIEENPLGTASRIVQGCEIEVDSVTSSVVYHRDMEEQEHENEEEYDYPYADRAKISLGLDRFQTKRSRPGALEHDNSIYAVVLENEKTAASMSKQSKERSVMSNPINRVRESDLMADAGNHGRNHTDPLPLPANVTTPPSDGTYTALLARTRSPSPRPAGQRSSGDHGYSPFPERTPGSGCSSTAPAPITMTRTPSAKVIPSVRPRPSPGLSNAGTAPAPLRPRGMSELSLSTHSRADSSIHIHRSKATVSHMDSNGYSTAIRTFSSMRHQPRRSAVKRKSRPSIELRQSPSPTIPPRLSESTIPPLSPDPTADFSMKTELLNDDSMKNPRYVNECVISPKQKPKERTRSRTTGVMRRARNVLPVPTSRGEESEKLYDDILPLREEEQNP